MTRRDDRILNKISVSSAKFSSKVDIHTVTMPGSQEPLSITLPTYHQLLLRQVREATHCVKSFDPATRTLTIFYWSPVLFDPSNVALTKNLRLAQAG